MTILFTLEAMFYLVCAKFTAKVYSVTLGKVKTLCITVSSKCLLSKMHSEENVVLVVISCVTIAPFTQPVQGENIGASLCLSVLKERNRSRISVVVLVPLSRQTGVVTGARRYISV